jgi:hypothetical protein
MSKSVLRSRVSLYIMLRGRERETEKLIIMYRISETVSLGLNITCYDSAEEKKRWVSYNHGCNILPR